MSGLKGVTVAAGAAFGCFLCLGALFPANAQTRKFQGTGDAIVDLSLSPDDSMLAGVTKEGGVLVWKVQTGAASTLVASGDARSVKFVAVGDEPRLLVGTRGEVSVWDPTAGAGVAAFPKGEDTEEPMIASKDGSRIAVEEYGVYRFYDVVSEKKLFEVEADDTFAPLAMGPKGELAAIGGDRQIRLIDLNAGKEIAPIRGLSEDPKRLAIHPNGRVLAVGLTNETQFWDLSRLPQPPKLLLREADLDANGKLEFVANGKLLAGTDGGPPQIWDAATKKMRPEVEGSQEIVVPSEDGSVLVMRASDNRTIVVDGASHRVRTVLEANVPPGKAQYDSGASGAYAVSSDGAAICIGLLSGDVEIHSSGGEASVEEIASYDVEVGAGGYGTQQPIAFLPLDDRLLYVSGFASMLIDQKTGDATALADPITERPFASETWFVGRTERRLIVPRSNGQLLKFDLASGAGEAAGTPRKFYAAGASPDGAKVAAVVESERGSAAQLVLLEAATGKALSEPLLTEAERDIRALFAWSADGSKLATRIGRKVRMWDVATREETALDADGDWRRIFLVDEGKTLALVDARVLRLVDLETAQLKSEVELKRFHTGRVFDAAVSPTDPVFASVGDAGEVLLRDLTTGDVLGRATGHERAVLGVSFDAEGARLATVEDFSGPAAREPLVRIKTWAVDAAKLKPASKDDLASGAPKAAPGAPMPSPQTLAEPKKLVEFEALINSGDYPRMWFSPDKKLLLAGSGMWSYTESVQGFDLATGASKFALEHIGRDLLFSPDGKFAFTYPGSRTAYSIDLATGQLHASDGDTYCVSTQEAIASTDDESFVFGLSFAGSTPIAEPALLKLDRTDPTKILAQWDVRAGDVRDIAALPDGALLVSLSERRERTKVLFFDPETFEVVGTLYQGEGRYGPILTVSPDGKLAMLEGVGIWSLDRKSQKLLADEESFENFEAFLGFAGDSGLSIHGDRSYRINLFDPVTRTVKRVIEPAKLPGFDRRTSKDSWSPDGRFMAAGTKDGEVVILDLVSGVDHPPKKLHEDEVYAVSFSADNTRMATACADGKIAVWSLDGSGASE